MPAGFTYRKKPACREYVRVRLDKAGIAHKHPVEGAGILTSLTETDGLVELPDDLTAVNPGDSVGFIPFASPGMTRRTLAMEVPAHEVWALDQHRNTR